MGGSFTKHTVSRLDQHVQNWFICPQCARLSLWWPLNCQTQEKEAVQSWSKMNVKHLWTVTCYARTSESVKSSKKYPWRKVDLVSHAPPQKVALSRLLFWYLENVFDHVCAVRSLRINVDIIHFCKPGNRCMSTFFLQTTARANDVIQRATNGASDIVNKQPSSNFNHKKFKKRRCVSFKQLWHEYSV